MGYSLFEIGDGSCGVGGSVSQTGESRGTLRASVERDAAAARRRVVKETILAVFFLVGS